MGRQIVFKVVFAGIKRRIFITLSYSTITKLRLTANILDITILNYCEFIGL